MGVGVVVDRTYLSYRRRAILQPPCEGPLGLPLTSRVNQSQAAFVVELVRRFNSRDTGKLFYPVQKLLDRLKPFQ
jgi:hypothetical protein